MTDKVDNFIIFSNFKENINYFEMCFIFKYFNKYIADNIFNSYVQKENLIIYIYVLGKRNWQSDIGDLLSFKAKNTISLIMKDKIFYNTLLSMFRNERELKNFGIFFLTELFIDKQQWQLYFERKRYLVRQEYDQYQYDITRVERL